MAGDLCFLGEPLAVIPIVVNAGAALLPAMIAGVTTFLALLLKPRELIRACRQRPAIAGGVLAGGLAVAALIYWRPAGDSATVGRRTRSGADAGAAAGTGAGLGLTVDWTQIALARLQARESGAALASPAPMPATPAAAAEPFVFRGGLTRTGAIGRPPAPPLRQAWRVYPRFKNDAGVEQVDTEAMILSSPAAHGDRIFGASCFLDPPKSFGTIFCVEAATGKQLWSVDRADGEEFKGFFSSPAVTADGRFLVIGQGLHPDANCRLVCVDAGTGRVHWTVKVPLHVESSPFIDGDVVYVGCGAIEDPATHRPISHPGFVLAVRISDGRELWRCDVADPESSPAVRDGVLYIGSGFNGNAVVALRTGTDAELQQRGEARLLWKTPTTHPITGAITLVGDLVVAGGGNGDFVFRDPHPAGAVLALDRRTGRVRWQTDLPDAVLGAVAAGASLICPVANGEVVALKPEDGTRLWSVRISGNAPVLAAPALAGQEIFAVSQDGYLARIGAERGEIRERHYLNAADRPGAQGLSISSPLVVNGRLYVGSETGGLISFIGGPTTP